MSSTNELQSSDGKKVANAEEIDETSTPATTEPSILTKFTRKNSNEKNEPRPRAKSATLPNVRPKSKSIDLKQQQALRISGTVIVPVNNKPKSSKETISKQVSVSHSDGSKGKILGIPKAIYISPPTSPPPGAFNTVKPDLPGRVSFSKIGNDVYEIDYSDFDTDTDTSHTDEPFRKKNVHFEDEYFSNSHRGEGDTSDIKKSTILNRSMRLNALPEDNENGNDSSAKIIEDYKLEIECINRQHELERRWNGDDIKMNVQPSSSADYSSTYLTNTSAAEHQMEFGKNDTTSGNMTASPPIENTSDDSPTRDSGITVINNYSKISKPKISNGTAAAKPSAAKKFTTAPPNRKNKSAQMSSRDAKTNVPQTNRLIKSKSVSHLHQQRVIDTKLNEFQIDKVESWMSTHEDTFSDGGGNGDGFNSYRKHGKFGSSSNLVYKKTWRETPTSKATDDEGNFSLDDQVDNTSIDGSIGKGIELVEQKKQTSSKQKKLFSFFRCNENIGSQ